MMKILKNEPNGGSDPVTHDYLGNEIIFKELYLKCQALENEKIEMLKIRQNLLILNEKNESISKRLSIMKTDFDFYKSQLQKTLFNLKVSADKQRILSRKKLDEFLKKTQGFQKYYKLSDFENELEELIDKNRRLQEELERKTDLFKVTKKQHVELVSFIMKTFQNKVCEFCHVLMPKPIHN